MFDKMKQLYDMQKQAKQMKKDLEAQIVEKTALGGKLKIGMNGTFEVKSISIDESLLNPGQKSTLESALSKLITETTEEIGKQSAAQAMDLMKGMNLKLPGM
jgi:DNA-binding YbaB/EbfC family protein